MNINNAEADLIESAKHFNESKKSKFKKQNEKISLCKSLSSEILEINNKGLVEKKKKNLGKKTNVVSKSSLAINEVEHAKNSLKKTNCVFYSSLDSKQQQMKENLLFKTQEKLENSAELKPFEKNKNVKKALPKPTKPPHLPKNSDFKTKNTLTSSDNYLKPTRDVPKMLPKNKTLNKEHPNEKSFDSISSSSSCSPNDFLLVNTSKNVTSGWLKVTKQGSNIFSRIPVKRWFMLSDEACHLFSFRNEQDYKLIDEIDLSKSVLSFKTSQITSEDNSSPNNRNKNSFEIRCKGILYVLEAGSAKEVLHWMRMLQASRKNFLEKVENTQYSVTDSLNTSDTTPHTNHETNNPSITNPAVGPNNNQYKETSSQNCLEQNKKKFPDVKQLISESIIKNRTKNYNDFSELSMKNNINYNTSPKFPMETNSNSNISPKLPIRINKTIDIELGDNNDDDNGGYDNLLGGLKVDTGYNNDKITIKTTANTNYTTTTYSTNNTTATTIAITTTNNNNNNNNNYSKSYQSNKIFPFLKPNENKKVSASFFKFAKKETTDQKNNLENNTNTAIGINNNNNNNNNNQRNNNENSNNDNNNNINNNSNNKINENDNKKYKKEKNNKTNRLMKIKKGNSFFFTKVSDNTDTEFIANNTIKKAASLGDKEEEELHHYDVLELPVHACAKCRDLSLELKTLQHDRLMLTEELASSHKTIQELTNQLQVKDTLIDYWKEFFKEQRLNDTDEAATKEHCGVSMDTSRCHIPYGNNNNTNVNSHQPNNGATNHQQKSPASFIRKSFSFNRNTLKQPTNSRTSTFFVEPTKDSNIKYEKTTESRGGINDAVGVNGGVCGKVITENHLYSKVKKFNNNNNNNIHNNNTNEKKTNNGINHNKTNNNNIVYINSNMISNNNNNNMNNNNINNKNINNDNNNINNKPTNSTSDSLKDDDGYSTIELTKDNQRNIKETTNQKYEPISLSCNYDNICISRAIGDDNNNNNNKDKNNNNINKIHNNNFPNNNNNNNKNSNKHISNNNTNNNNEYEDEKSFDFNPQETKSNNYNDEAWFVFDKDSFSVEERALEWYKDERDAFITQNSILNEEIYQLNRCFEMMDKRQDETEIEKTRLQAEVYNLKSSIVKAFKVLMDLSQGGSLTISEEKLSEILTETMKCDLKNYNIEGLESKFDKYGFEKEFKSPFDMFHSATNHDDSDNARNILDFYPFKRRQVEMVSSTRWESVLISMEVALSSNTLNSADAEYKHLVRMGVPGGLRARLWKVCIDRLIRPYRNNKRFMAYPDLLNLINNKKVLVPLATQIELDLYRTLPNNMHFSASYTTSESKIDALRNILQAFSVHNPLVGYCQGLNRIAAVLLLLLEEEEAYWGLVAMVELIMPANYYDKTLLGAHIDQRVLKDLAADKLPNLTAHFASLQFDHSLFTFPWFITIFVDNFPIETSLRIWDSFLLEGDKVLFRYALAVMKYFESGLLECKGIHDLNHFIRGMCAKVHNTNKLSQIAFTDLNPFSYKTIKNKRRIYKQTMTKELEEMERLRSQFIEITTPQVREPNKGPNTMNNHRRLDHESSNDLSDSY